MNKKHYVAIGNTYGITANSEPVYDSWGWDDSWNCEQWIVYFNALKAAHGTQAASQIWQNKWANVTFSSWQYQNCLWGPNSFAFIRDMYESSEGLINLGNMTNNIMDFTDATGEVITDVATNLADTATTTSKIIKYGVPIAVAYMIYKTAKRA